VLKLHYYFNNIDGAID